jgi:G patch domain-containing protein 1
MPYSEDLDKRARYTAFLTLSAGLSSTLPARPPTWTADQWAKELREFAQAAEVFKPISGLMATRFTTSTAKPKLATDAPDAPAEAPSKPADPAEEAARAGMYGPLTRSKHLFYPTRLLCKRFGAKPPANTGVDPGVSAAGSGAGEGGSGQGTSGLVSKAALDRMMMHASQNLPRFAKAGTEGGDSGNVFAAVEPEERAQVDAETNEALEGKRPGEEVFKSVFED